MKINPKMLLLLLLGLGMVQQSSGNTNDWRWVQYGIARTDNPACIPTSRTESWAMDQHKTILDRCRWVGLRVVFLGDSITHGLQWTQGPEGGAAVWEKYFAPLKASTYAVPGDKTQHVLWRITEGGELDGINPKVLVLLIGINNLINDKAILPEQAAEGITAIVQCVRTKLPDTRILLLGIFPCWERERVRQTNEIIRKLEDLRYVYYLDIGDKFMEADGTIRKEKLRDGLHPSEMGYEIWAESMQPYLEDLLNNDGQGELWKKRIEGKPPQ